MWNVFCLPCMLPIGYFVSTETTSTTEEDFPLVLFQFDVWSKCWANALFHATFLFENDFSEYNAQYESQ